MVLPRWDCSISANWRDERWNSSIGNELFVGYDLDRFGVHGGAGDLHNFIHGFPLGGGYTPHSCMNWRTGGCKMGQRRGKGGAGKTQQERLLTTAKRPGRFAFDTPGQEG